MVGSEGAERFGEGGARRPVDGDGDGAREVASDEAANDAEHSGTAVLEFGEALALELLGVHLGSQADRVPEVLEALERARRAPRHVVRLNLPLRLVLNDENRADNLELADLGHCLPLLHRAASSRNVCKRRARLPSRAVAWEVDAVVAIGHSQLVARRDQPAEEGCHGDAAVLQLSVAHPRERRRRANCGADGTQSTGEIASSLHRLLWACALQGGARVQGGIGVRSARPNGSQTAMPVSCDLPSLTTVRGESTSDLGEPSLAKVQHCLSGAWAA